MRYRSRVLGALVVIAVAGVLTLGFMWHWAATNDATENRRPELTELVKAVGTFRPLEARLTGGFAYGSIADPRRSAAAARELTPDTRIAIARIEKKAVGSSSETDWAALGTSYLLAGDLDKGLEFLEAAAATPSPDPQWLSDLSAAYLAVGERNQRYELIPKALSAAERACRLNGTLREPAFNRALAIEALHLSDQASSAWEQYRAMDPGSPWSKEALVHLSNLKKDDAQESALWGNVLRALETGEDRRSVDVRDLGPVRQRLRTWIEMTLLPAWAEHELSGDNPSAREQLRRARVAADLLVDAGGDPMAKDGIRAIDTALRDPSGQVTQRLARAHLALVTVVRRFDDGAVAEANTMFQSVGPDFAVGHSPYVHWGSIYVAVAHYAARRFDSAEGALEPGDRDTIDRSYRYLAGRRKWLLGLLLVNEGQFMGALVQYQAALADLQAVGESESAASVTSLLAETFERLGAPREAWRYELAALAELPQIEPIRRKHAIVQLAGLISLDEGLLETTRHFQDAVIALSSGVESRASSLAEGYFHRAQIDERLGDIKAATEDLTRATALLSHIGDPSLRRREEAEVNAAAAEVYRDSMPREAVAAASRALEFFGGSGGEFKSISLYLARARAQLATRQVDLAQADLNVALQHFQQQRSRLPDRQFRASFFRDGSAVFAEMVKLQVVWRDDLSTGLDYAEQGRARTLLEGIAHSPKAQPVSLPTLQRSLPDRIAVLFFVTLEDRTLVWSIRSGDVHISQVSVGTATLRTEVERLRWLLRRTVADDEPLKRDLEALFLQLVAPALQFLDGADTLVVVPDGPLHALPFAALMNPQTGRYLIEDYIFATAPSLSTLARHDDLTSPLDLSPRALIVGNPTREGATEDSGLPPLPFSEEEAVNVAAFYQDSLLLKDRAATKRAFLENATRSDIVHYAGHALVNEQEPLLSRLLLARDTVSGDDGSLFVSELGQLNLARTRLVVLAGCSTGAGMIGDGEGVFSLARAFLEAGASAVVATLWDVPDKSASQLFQEFHRHLAAGQTPATALSYVQRQFAHHANATLRSPAHWAWAVPIGTLY